MSEEIKLCRDCVYYSDRWDEKCLNAKKTEATFSLVNGYETKVDYFYCSTQRGYECGEEAKHFKPKPKTWWQKLWGK